MRAAARTAFGVVVVIVLAGFAGWIIIRAVDSEPGIVGSVLVGTLGLAGVALDRQRQQRAELQQAHRDKLRPHYEGFVAQLRRSAEETGEPDQALLAGLQDELILSGSARVIRAWVRFRQLSVAAESESAEPGSSASMEMFYAFEDLLLAIRADLGLDDSDLERADVLRVFITDLDDYLPGE